MERSKIQESARQRKAPETEIDTEIEIERSGHCLCLTSLSRVSISHPLGQAMATYTEISLEDGEKRPRVHICTLPIFYFVNLSLYTTERG